MVQRSHSLLVSRVWVCTPSQKVVKTQLGLRIGCPVQRGIFVAVLDFDAHPQLVPKVTHRNRLVALSSDVHNAQSLRVRAVDVGSFVDQEFYHSKVSVESSVVERSKSV